MNESIRGQHTVLVLIKLRNSLASAVLEMKLSENRETDRHVCTDTMRLCCSSANEYAKRVSMFYSKAALLQTDLQNVNKSRK